MNETSWLGDMHLFVAVAHARSFKQAAAALKMPNSTLSRRISNLETAIGLRLLNRTTRWVELTEDGTIYLQSAERILQEARLAHEDLRHRVGKPSGILRMAMPESLGWVATRWLAEFSAQYPQIKFEIDSTHSHINPVVTNFDLCIHDGGLPDSTFTLRPVGSFRRTLFASPSYVADHGYPAHPDELIDHRCICVGESASARTNWTMTKAGRTVSVSVSGVIACVSLNLAPEFAREGMGIAPGVTRYFADHVRKGDLVPILPDWQFEPLNMSVVLPTKLLPAKTRIFLDFLSEKMKGLKRQFG